ncbi:pentatricopeptide repeat-containing protein At1g63130, mitochondrial-like [Lotus japonicus]|uniref:pentatricopeptide repeat-containing protein At1g63130, mitochondrial-like n=1 Tax=Lotus japonicus TaxID=34305 RepID=UPI002587FF88|nr:pentatricopeptide repeat-containing protein At1g63130, mitochondrial-like [Lotus japonicus]
MKDQGVLLDVYAYNVLMDGMTKSGRFVDAKEIFQMLQTKGYPLTIPSYDTMIHALCKEDFLDESLGLFSEMEVRDCLPDAITFDIIIRTLLDKGEKVKAAEFIHIMNERFGILNRYEIGKLVGKVNLGASSGVLEQFNELSAITVGPSKTPKRILNSNQRMRAIILQSLEEGADDDGGSGNGDAIHGGGGPNKKKK